MSASLTASSVFRVFLALFGAAILLVPDAHRSVAYLSAEVLVDAAIFLLVFRGGAGRGPALKTAVAALLLADILYALKYLWAGFPELLFRVQVTAYLVYSLSAAAFLFKAYRASEPQRRIEPALLLALFACFTALQIKYVVIPVSTGIYASAYVYALSMVHRTAESAVLALAVVLGMKARSRYWFLTLIALTLLPLSSFAIGYSANITNGVPFAEYGWVLGLLVLLAAQTYPAGGERPFAAWSSVRVRLVWLVSSLAAVMLLLLYLTHAFGPRDFFSLTSSLFFLLFGVWLAANLIALRVSEDLDGLLAGVEAGAVTAPAGGSALTIYEAELFAGRLKAAYDTIKSQSRLAALSAISAQVAHDIRSPLAALESALKDVSQLPEEKRQLIRGAACRIKDIADDLLEKNRAAPADGPAPCLLAGLIEGITAEKRLQFRERGNVAVALRLDPDASGLRAMVRRSDLGRILSNLINNGAEALERGGTVTVGLSRQGDFASLTVTDDGKGIPPEVLGGLGGRGVTADKAGGCGLGLYHARTTAESWGGGLSITSGPGKGTTVTLRLPLAAGTAPAARTAALLDDDSLVRLNWGVAAKAAGVELKAYGSAAELLAAAELLPKDTPLYIDSDLGGGAPGEEVAGELRLRGFTDITMATGHEAGKFSGLPWLKVAGKEPPWQRQP
ncbi:MAG: sensor histidine kinase [Elusimicrobiales bacterium]